ncbi:cell surface protein [Alcanivorax sp. N3-2A]|nr:cell surface protein [Alcanivorax sp. N3-2A]|tara:strand:+ start:17439 stop:19193 length:1755 start_codon:yes stop_codon:yes gene_type:complete
MPLWNDTFKLGALAIAISLTLTACGSDSDNDNDDVGGEPAPQMERLTRVATLPLGSEATGLFMKEDGEVFTNIQHPSDANVTADAAGEVYRHATVGLIEGADIHEHFEPVSVPQTDEEKQIMRVALGHYNVLGQQGDVWAGAPDPGLGGIAVQDGSALIRVSNDPDFNGWVPLDEDEGYLFTNWEDRPGGMSRLHLVRDADGHWQVLDNDASMVDFSGVKGTWVNCFGTVSPWNTPLTSEELYFDETRDWNSPSQGEVQDLADYLAGEINTDYAVTYPNPYDYGYIVEITDPTGTPTPVKHFTLGRYSHENAVVMPDQKTVYMSDDGGGVIMFKFVADTAGDLSTGTLFAAKVSADGIPMDAAEAGFDMEWVELAHASNTDIEGWVDQYDDVTVADYVDGANSYITDQQVNDWAESKLEQDLDASGDVAANPFGDDRVAFLESRKAAVKLGATGEFNKMEGININTSLAQAGVEEDGPQAYVYVAMSTMTGNMTDDQGEIQLTNDGTECGGVWRMPLEDGYNVSRLEMVELGGPYQPTDPENTCSVDGLSGPDNVAIMNDGRVLIGEDTGGHQNNMVWLLDPDA